MSEVIIFGYPQSTYVRTVRMSLEEKGIPYALEPVDLKAPEYRKRHPFAKMPAFQHGDVKMYETSAITRYVDKVFDGAPLQPTDIQARADMNRWISAINDYLYPAMVRRYVLEYVFPSGKDGAPDRDKINAAMEDVGYQLGVLDGDLDGRKYLAGDSLSLADLFLAPIAYYLSNMPESRQALETVNNVKAWHDAMAQRPSYSQTIPPPPPGA